MLQGLPLLLQLTLGHQPNAPINVMPHYPPPGRLWGHHGGIDKEIPPHTGAFDFIAHYPHL